jgi:chloramphenicol-sensitive protein RarD
MSLLLGIFVFKEPFDRVQAIALIIIWTGLAVFTWGEFVNSRKREQEAADGASAA